MDRLRETFFSDAKVRVIKRFILSSKLMKNLVHLIFAVLCLFLNMEREFSFDNLLGLTEQPAMRFEEVRFAFMQTATTNANTVAATAAVSGNTSAQRKTSKATPERQPVDENVSARDDPQSFINNESSLCSKCSCHLRQSNKDSRSFLSKASSKRSARARQATQDFSAHNINLPSQRGEEILIEGEHTPATHKTIEEVAQVEQHSYVSKQSSRVSTKAPLQPHPQKTLQAAHSTAVLPSAQEQSARTRAITPERNLSSNSRQTVSSRQLNAVTSRTNRRTGAGLSNKVTTVKEVNIMPLHMRTRQNTLSNASALSAVQVKTTNVPSRTKMVANTTGAKAAGAKSAAPKKAMSFGKYNGLS